MRFDTSWTENEARELRELLSEMRKAYEKGENAMELAR
jgi:uncharacterized protein YktA (UPF0223 family)